MVSAGDLQTIKRKLDMIEETFTSIRDHRGVDTWTRGRADSGQGMVASLRGLLSRVVGHPERRKPA